ncbi:MAG: hypothetical protein ACKPJD_20355, partial [Planctomycetaceae bacterium]
RNARYFASAGAGELVDTGAADISKTGAAVQLRGLLRDLSRDADRRQRMSVAAARLAVPDAATSAAAAVLEIAMRQG